MGKYKDWMRCSYYNRFTLAAILGIPASVGFMVYGLLEKSPYLFATGSGLIPLSWAGLKATHGGKDTLEAYNRTIERFEKEKKVSLTSSLRNIPYCEKKGIELAIRDFERRKFLESDK